MSEDSVRVLIVESNDADREQYKGILAGETFEEGLALVEAASGEEGLQACQSEPPDCVVLGEKLADMGATAFLEQLADESGAVAMPVIVVISRRSRKAVNEVMERGARDWLPKDQAGAVLPRAVRYIVERRVEDLRAAEHRALFRALLTGTPGLLVLKNQTLQYEAVNPAFCQFIGKGPEELVACTDTDLLPKEDAAALEAEDRKAMASGIAHTVVQHVGPEDKKRWLEISRSPITDANGDATGLLWSARDITEFKAMEDAVRESGEPLRTLAADQTELACRLAPDFALTFVNEPLCRFFGKSREELLGESFVALMPEEEQQAVQEQLAALTAADPVAVREFAVVAAEGAICWQRWTVRALFAEDGGLSGYQAVGSDATSWKRAQDASVEHEQRLKELEQRAAETEGRVAEQDKALAGKDAQLQQLGAHAEELEGRLQDTEERLAETLNLFPAPFCELGAKTRVTFFNRAGLETFGFTEEEVAKGIALIDLFHPNDKNRATEAMRATIEGKPAEPGEYRMLRKDGSELTVQLVCAPKLQEGKVAGLRCCLLNLVDRQRMQTALGSASQMADAAAKAAALSQNVSDLMLVVLQKMTETGAAAPEGAKLQELQEVVAKVGELVQQMRAAVG